MLLRFALALIILLHAIIHFAGFAKAFSYAGLPQIKAKITKNTGRAWLLAGVLSLVTTTLLLLKKDGWWIIGSLSAVISQVLIIMTWKEAKPGTLVNIVLLFASLGGYGTWHFVRTYKKDVSALIQTMPAQHEALTEADIAALPVPVKKYIRYTNSIGKPKISSFKVEFKGNLRKNENEAWMHFQSQQYNFMKEPSRLFFMKAFMYLLPVTGYHHYANGGASMDIRLLSLFNLQYQEGKEMGIAETVTFFNDMCCMAPATLTDKRIKWVSVEENKVQASFTTNTITVSAWLYFNEKGELVNFISDDRYAVQEDGTMKRVRWSTPLRDYKDVNGYRLATYAETTYHYPEKDLTYGNFTLTGFYPNPQK